ncbi:MAG TPA: type II toxin-antitoxin system Phd/YefM family antitoxin [Gammaproteobacteria bacterium]|nr:type II toxin-antitoxin system Phd/YefM family antitoxin [Gammaproteobacteria bacterium]
MGITNMTIRQTPRQKTWTISEAKARLSEVLRLAGEEGPQYIGTKKSFVVIPEAQWRSLQQPKKPLGLWLVENMPRIGELELPDRREPDRDVSFE